jgi:hypothetical protein
MNKKPIYKKNRSNSFNMSELNMSKHNNNKTNSNNTINNSLSNCFANNNSCSGSGYKPKKKSINLINKSSHKNNNKVTTIPLDKNLLKTKLNNRKKKFL